MAEQQDNNQAANEAEGKQGQFAIQKIYVKDVSFESPLSPQIFQEQWKPAVNMDISNSINPLSNELFEVVLAVTVTVTVEEKSVYLVEIHQAGIFHLTGVPKQVLERTLATACPNILFPFAREAVSDLITRGGFPQLLLAPVNFEALYLQQQQQTDSNDSEETKH